MRQFSDDMFDKMSLVMLSPHPGHHLRGYQKQIGASSPEDIPILIAWFFCLGKT
jgi:hypothetical protein